MFIKCKHYIDYVIVGSLTTVINLGTFNVLLFSGVDYKASNIFALILGRIFAYAANKLLVFKTHCKNYKELFFEMFRFITARGITAFVDFFGLVIAVEIFKFSTIYSKYTLTFIAIILNYILARNFVYRRAGENEKKYF
jgi:putative flippase GtrA